MQVHPSLFCIPTFGLIAVPGEVSIIFVLQYVEQTPQWLARWGIYDSQVDQCLRQIGTLRPIQGRITHFSIAKSQIELKLARHIFPASSVHVCFTTWLVSQTLFLVGNKGLKSLSIYISTWCKERNQSKQYSKTFPYLELIDPLKISHKVCWHIKLLAPIPVLSSHETNTHWLLWK